MNICTPYNSSTTILILKVIIFLWLIMKDLFNYQRCVICSPLPHLYRWLNSRSFLFHSPKINLYLIFLYIYQKFQKKYYYMYLIVYKIRNIITPKTVLSIPLSPKQFRNNKCFFHISIFFIYLVQLTVLPFLFVFSILF